MAEGFYDRHVLPRLLDFACGLPPLAEQRRRIVPQARGDVLEIGIGTGLNLPYYAKTAVTRLVAVDPALQMNRRAAERARRAGLAVELIGLSAERLPLPDATFDTIVCTYTLCSIPQPDSALAEMRRVLKPGGRLLLSEHGVAPDAAIQRWQQRLQPLWGRLFGGCSLSVDIPALLKASGFDAGLQAGYVTSPKFAGYHYWGAATATP